MITPAPGATLKVGTSIAVSGATTGTPVTITATLAGGGTVTVTATVGPGGVITLPASLAGKTLTGLSIVLGATSTAPAQAAAQTPAKHAPAQLPAKPAAHRTAVVPAKLPKSGAGGGADPWGLLILPLLVLSSGVALAWKKAGR